MNFNLDQIRLMFKMRRELPIALAMEMAATKHGSDRMLMLNRLFIGMTPEQRMQCTLELHRHRHLKELQASALPKGEGFIHAL